MRSKRSAGGGLGIYRHQGPGSSCKIMLNGDLHINLIPGKQEFQYRIKCIRQKHSGIVRDSLRHAFFYCSDFS